MILFVTNADTELLALRTITEGLPPGFPPLRAAHPDRLAATPDLTDVDLVVVRLLGGGRAWEAGLGALVEACGRRGVRLLAFGGEATPDAELVALSSAPSATVVQAFEYLVQGGPRNVAHMLRFLVDTLLMEGFGFEPPLVVPDHGVMNERRRVTGRPTIAVVFYRAHLVAGNTGFVDDLCESLEAAGANALPVYCYSLRPAAAGLPSPVVELLAEHQVAAVITTVLAAGSLHPGEEAWDPGALATLDVPVLQAICATTSSAQWAASSRGLSPVDVAMAVAIPEFDGRVVSVPFSFKEEVDDGDELGVPVSAYRTQPDRTERVARLALGLARLRSRPPAERRIALVLSAYPTRRSRLGNAVGLDTPASVVKLLEALALAGYRVDRIPGSGDELMGELADRLTYDEPVLAPHQAALAVGRWPVEAYTQWFATLPADARAAVEEAWGLPPARCTSARSPSSSSAGSISAGCSSPSSPREGLARTRSPSTTRRTWHPPTTTSASTAGWTRAGEPTPSSTSASTAPSSGCRARAWGSRHRASPTPPSATLPLVYPFVVNDPGEGTQAKRRGHAVIVDHLLPPMTRADTYDDLARLEQLLDAHAQVASLDPAKLPAVRRQVWDLLVEAEIHRDLGLGARDDDAAFEDPAFDDLLVQVDGYLCELKDAQIRGGLHVLGTAPEGAAELDMVAAITRLPQGPHRSLRDEVADELGLGDDLVVGRTARRPTGRGGRGPGPPRRTGRVGLAGDPDGASARRSRGSAGAWCPICAPARRRSTPCWPRSTGGASPPDRAGPRPAGWPTSCRPGATSTPSIPRRSPPRWPGRSAGAWPIGCSSAMWPKRAVCQPSVGLVVWGTSAMRTGGDDVAEALALLGVRPVWDADERAGDRGGAASVPPSWAGPVST